MGINLAGEGFQAGLNQVPLLLLELAFVAGVVPDLDRNRDGEQGGGINRRIHQEIGLRRVQIENPAFRAEGLAQRLPQKLGEQNHDEEEQVESIVAVEAALLEEAPQVQVEERTEAPDILR